MIKHLSFIAAVLLNTTLTLQAQIRLDGNFTDWETPAANYQETVEELPGPDLSAFAISNDEEYLYLYIKADKEFKLHDQQYFMNPAEVDIYLDTDNNAATGLSIEKMGAELHIKAGQRYALYYGAGESTSLNLHRLGLLSLPTVTSSQYEIAISLKGIDGGATPLFSSADIRLLIKEQRSGDKLPDQGSFAYTIRKDLPQDYSPVSVRQAEREEPQLRLMSHNTEHDGLMDMGRKEAFSRLYGAIAPDILSLNENWDTPAETAKAFMDERLPLTTRKGWYVSKRVYGNITLSRFPILESWEVSEGERLAANLIDLPDSLFRRDILVINAHLQCCDKDSRRQSQVDATIRFILDAQTTGGQLDLPLNTPIVISGDLNLVGDSQQLKTLLLGSIQNTNTYGEGRLPDWNETALQDLHPLHTDQPFAHTWRNPFGSYPPSRLDYILYTGSVMAPQKGFVLNPMGMPPASLEALGILKEDAEVSDHFPVVADFSLKGCLEPRQEVHISGLPDTFKVSDASVRLEGHPADGKFRGAGIEGNTFDPALAGEGIHEITYTVWNEEGCSSSHKQQVVVKPQERPNGIADPLLEQLRLMPNPASDIFQLLLPERPSQPVLITLYTIEGRLIFQEKIYKQQTELPLEGVSPGMLLLQLRTEKGQKTLRLLKSNN